MSGVKLTANADCKGIVASLHPFPGGLAHWTKAAGQRTALRPASPLDINYRDLHKCGECDHGYAIYPTG
ncbi:hypothetical protein PJI17_14140 [Mycobacterium kansasii]